MPEPEQTPEIVDAKEADGAKDLAPIILDKSGEEIEVKGHLFTPIVLAAPEGKSLIIKLSQRERRFLARLMNTQNLELASKEIGISMKAGRAFMKRKGVKLYLEEKLAEAALSSDTTIQNNIAWLRRVRDGETEADKHQMEAAKTLARIHKPASAGTTVKVQQNNISGVSSVPNPYSEMDTATIIAQTKEALNVVDGRPTTTP